MASDLGSVELIRRLVSYDTTSRNSNLALIDFIEDYLNGHGVKATRIYDKGGQKANLFATLGPEDKGGIILSGHVDVVPVDGQHWSTDPFEVIEKDGRLYGRGPRPQRLPIRRHRPGPTGLQQLLRLRELRQRELQLRVAARQILVRGRDAKQVDIDFALNHRLDEFGVLLPRGLVPFHRRLLRERLELGQHLWELVDGAFHQGALREKRAVPTLARMTPLELGLDTFGDRTRGKDGHLLSHAQVIRDLVEWYAERPAAIPDAYRLSDSTDLQAAVDYVAGMSDKYAMRMHDERFRPSGLY